VNSIFLWEYLCGGAVENPRSYGSLFEEGRAMLFALLEDFSRCGKFDLVTTCEASLQCEIDNLDTNARSIPVGSSAEELALFSQLAKEADFTFAIAPETAGVLLSRRDLVDLSGGSFVGCGREAIAICGDKWRTFQRLEKTDIPQIPTRLLPMVNDFQRLTYPLVCKPRDGAGCCDTFLVRDKEELRELVKSGSLDVDRTILQPFVEGIGFSVAALFERSEVVELLPAVRHRMNYERTISCCAMEIDPAFRVPASIGRIVETVGHAIAGFEGYVGLDFILPKGNSSVPVLVEINPRLTTSYLEYRKAEAESLAERLLEASIPFACEK